MSSLLRHRLVSIIGQPAIAGDYRDRLQRIVEDAYERMWRDPKLQLVNRTIRDMFQRAGGEQLAAALLPLALPRLRTAAFELMLPSWQAMHDLVVEGKLDTGPLVRAPADIMVDPDAKRPASRQARKSVVEGKGV